MSTFFILIWNLSIIVIWLDKVFHKRNATENISNNLILNLQTAVFRFLVSSTLEELAVKIL